jgi:hypothetical protein
MMQTVKEEPKFRNQPIRHEIHRASHELDRVEPTDWKRSDNNPFVLGSDELSVQVGTRKYTITVPHHDMGETPELVLTHYPDSAPLNGHHYPFDNKAKEIATELRDLKKQQSADACEALADPKKLLESAAPGSVYGQRLVNGGGAIHWRIDVETEQGVVRIDAQAIRSVVKGRYGGKDTNHYSFIARANSDQFKLNTERFTGPQLKELYLAASGALKKTGQK